MWPTWEAGDVANTQGAAAPSQPHPTPGPCVATERRPAAPLARSTTASWTSPCRGAPLRSLHASCAACQGPSSRGRATLRTPPRMAPLCAARTRWVQAVSSGCARLAVQRGRPEMQSQVICNFALQVLLSAARVLAAVAGQSGCCSGCNTTTDCLLLSAAAGATVPKGKAITSRCCSTSTWHLTPGT